MEIFMKDEINNLIEMPYLGFGNDYQIAATPGGRIFLCSGSLKLLLSEDLTGRNLNDVFEDSFAAAIISAISAGSAYEFDTTVSGYTVHCMAEPIGEHIGIALYPTNEKGPAFIDPNSATFISSEINSILGSMMPALSLLKSGTQSPEEKYAILSRNTYRLLRLSRNLKDCGDASNGNLPLNKTEVDITELTRDICEKLAMYTHRLGFSFEYSLPSSPLICRVDVEKYLRILLNLISNSIKALGKDGKISLSLSETGDNIMLRIDDTGSGIDVDALGDIFERHRTNIEKKPLTSSGIGFGLALVKAYAERHGGRLMLYGSQDHGTGICLTLPRNTDGDLSPIASPLADYATGYDKILLELSTVLPSEFFE